MPCSPARLAANRRNAQKSTGPRTPAGKDAARWNSLQHGLAGSSDRIAPGEDPAELAALAEVFARELRATGAVGRFLAARAAVLTVRIERAAARDEVAVAAQVAAAHDRFDQQWTTELDELVATLNQGGDEARAAAEALAEVPNGLDELIRGWERISTGLISPAGDVARATARQASAWFGGRGPERDADPAVLAGRVEVELARLRTLVRSPALDRAAAAVAAARAEAGALALFDSSREGELVRRYDAANVREFHRTLAAIDRLNRAAGRAARAVAPLAPDSTPPASSPPPRSVETSGSFRTPTGRANPEKPTTLGSFRDVAVDAASPRPGALIEVAAGRLPAGPERPRRPDLRKLAKKR